MIALATTLLFGSLLIIVNGRELELLAVSQCSKKVNGPIKFFGTIKKSGLVDIEMNFPFDFVENDQFHLAIHTFVQGQWIFDHEADGSICPEINQFIKKAWQKIRKISEPEIVDECHISKGNYTIKDIQLNSNDVYMPSGLTGKYKFDLTLFKYDEEAVCWSVSINITP